MDMVGVGSLYVDLIYEVPSLKIDGMEYEAGTETIVDERSFDQVVHALQVNGILRGRTAGGSAANVAHALYGFGFSTGLLGVVGKDNDASFFMEEEKDVDTSMLKKYEHTGKRISLISDQGHSSIIVPGSNDMFSFTEDDIDQINEATTVHLGPFAGDNALASQKRLVDRLEEGISITLGLGDMYARRGTDQIEDLISRSSILFGNERDITVLTGEGLKDGCRSLLEMGPTMIACILGDQGSLIMTRRNEINIPSKRTKPIDRTSAEDVFCSAFIAGMLAEAPLEMCGEMATAAAALSVTSFGRAGYPDERFLRRYLKRLG